MIVLSMLSSALSHLLPAIALAVEMPPPVVCTGLVGCGAGPSNVILTNTLPAVGMVLIQIAGGGAVIAIVVAGVQMVVSGGDDSKITAARKGILYALGGLGLAITATSIVSFVVTEDYGLSGGVVGVMSSVIRIIMTLFNVAFCIVIILAGLRMITSGADGDASGEFKNAGKMIKWAIIGAVIVNIAKAGIEAFLALNL